MRIKRALSLVEILVVLFLIALFSGLVGIPIGQQLLAPTGNEKIAAMLASLSQHAQGWSLENGRTLVLQINLTDNALSFHYLDEKAKPMELEDKIFQKRTLPENIQITALQNTSIPQEHGKVSIPFLPTGFSLSTILYLTEKDKNITWTLFFPSIFGDVHVWPERKEQDDILKANYDAY